MSEQQLIAKGRKIRKQLKAKSRSLRRISRASDKSYRKCGAYHWNEPKATKKMIQHMDLCHEFIHINEQLKEM